MISVGGRLRLTNSAGEYRAGSPFPAISSMKYSLRAMSSAGENSRSASGRSRLPSSFRSHGRQRRRSRHQVAARRDPVARYSPRVDPEHVPPAREPRRRRRTRPRPRRWGRGRRCSADTRSEIATMPSSANSLARSKSHAGSPSLHAPLVGAANGGDRPCRWTAFITLPAESLTNATSARAAFQKNSASAFGKISNFGWPRELGEQSPFPSRRDRHDASLPVVVLPDVGVVALRIDLDDGGPARSARRRWSVRPDGARP